MSLRSSWEGFLKLNLLSVPVKAFSSTVSGSGKIRFHQIHSGCGSRIRHKKVCPIHGEVSNEEIESGYEYTKGQYVIVEADELNKVRQEDEKSVTIDVFIHPDALDPMYSTGRTYYLTPDGKVGQKPYAVLRQVMSDQKRYAIARIVMSGRQQLVLIRPVEGLLVMTLLSFEDQVKKPATFQDEAPEVELPRKEVELAEMLVNASTVDDFDLSSYHDEYENELTELIEAKAKGKKIVDRRSSETPNVINLMDALRESLNQAKKSSKKRPVQRAPKRKKTG